MASRPHPFPGKLTPLQADEVRRLLIVAEGSKFVVTSPPDLSPCGDRSSTFRVMGPTTVALGGRAVLLELLLEEHGECSR